VSAKLTVGRLLERLKDTLELEHIPTTNGLDRPIENPNASSPGLVLAGYTARFPARRLQVFGETEITYLKSLDAALRQENLKKFFSFPIPCVFITKGQQPGPDLHDLAAAAGIAIIRSTLKTDEFYTRLKPWLENEFSPTTNLHASLADVFGVGLLLVGKSGIGKSECVLDLVERGHRFVADDLVIARRRGRNVVLGRGHDLQQHHMEIRGVGLIDIPALFGVRAVRHQKRIEVVVQLEEWRHDAVVDRTGLDGETTDILGVPIPRITIPLNPGKNITVIAEVIAMHHLLKWSGIDPAERFNEALIKQMRDKSEINRYLREDHE
jgi:HPr kinase/phosphorylase